VYVNDCGLARDIPRNTPFADMLRNFDQRSCGVAVVIDAFTGLTVLEARNNFIEDIGGRPWPALQQCDMSGNNISSIHSAWFSFGAPLLQDFSRNPNLRIDFPPVASHCSDAVALQADPGGFIPVLGELYACTVPCSSGGFILRIDADVDEDILCKCLPGHYGVGKRCTAAAEDFWAPGGTDFPTPCDSGSSTFGAVAADSVTACECYAGLWRNGTGTAATCVPCPMNTFRLTRGATMLTECRACTLGQYANQGSTACEECPDGTVGNAMGGCRECPAGQRVNDGGDECVPCTVGKYRPLQGNFSECRDCPAGKTTWRWTEEVAEYILFQGASSVADCGCVSGSMPDDDSCVTCGTGQLAGVLCPGGLTAATIRVEEGYYSDFQLSVYSCYGDTSRCPGGSPGLACPTGREDITCALCEDGKVPADGGRCEECTATGDIVLPIAIVLALGAAVFLYIIVDKTNHGTQSNTTLAAAIALSMLVSIIQQAGVLYVVNVEWVSPLSGVLRSLRLLNFDIEVLQLSCYANVDPMMIFCAKILVIIVAIVVVISIHCLAVLCVYKGRWRERIPTLIGVVGAVSTVFYIAVVSAITGPLQCQDHPNGKWTSRIYKSTTCWDSEVHSSMVIIALCAFCIPLSYIAAVARVVQLYPSKVVKADVNFLKAFTFIFYRFTPEGYWYILVYMMRSLLFGLAPIIPSAELTIILMQLTVLLALALTVRFLPWRFRPACWLDVAFSAMILLLLSAASFFAPDSTTSRKKLIAWFCVGTILCSLMLAPGMLVYWVLQRCLRIGKRFEFFLTHHKAGAGAFARLMKLHLSEKWLHKDRVFLDADNLQNLDMLFDHVKEETETLLALATRDLLLRPWCLGEVVVAFQKRVRCVLVQLPDYDPPSADFIVHVEDFVDVHELTQRGLTKAMIEASLHQFKELPPVVVEAPVTSRIIQALVLRLRKASGAASPDAAKEPSNFAIAVDNNHAEAVCTALVLEKMVSYRLILNGSKNLPAVLASGSVPAKVSRAIVLCSTGCFESDPLLLLLLQLAHANVHVFPVLAEDSFRVPTRKSAMFDGDRFQHNEVVVEFILNMFKSIAASFIAQHASFVTLKTCVEGIVARLPGDGSGSNTGPSGGNPRVSSARRLSGEITPGGNTATPGTGNVNATPGLSTEASKASIPESDVDSMAGRSSAEVRWTDEV